MDDISPWLFLPQDETNKGKIRKKLLYWALLFYRNAVDPYNPDILLRTSTNTRQSLVHSAYIITESFLCATEI